MRELIRKYGSLSLYLIGVGGWLVTLPASGTVWDTWVTAHATTSPPGPIWFLSTVALSLVIGGVLSDRHPAVTPTVLRIAVLCNMVFTLAIAFLPDGTWPVWLGAMGIASGLGVIAWVRIFTQTVAREHLGRAYAVIATGIALVVWVDRMLSDQVSPAVALWASIALLAGAFTAVRTLGKPVQLSEQVAAQTATQPPTRKELLHLTTIIGCLAIVGGITRFLLIVPNLSGTSAALLGVAFIFGAVTSGIIADQGRLHLAAVLGAGLLALSALIDTLGTGPRLDLVCDSLMGISVGLVEPIPWLLFASKSTPHSSGRWFGWGLNVYVVRIATGLFVAKFLNWLPEQHLYMLGAVSTMYSSLCLCSMSGSPMFFQMLLTQRGVLPSAISLVPLHNVTPGVTSNLLEHYCSEKLSSRELEVGRLAVDGTSTRCIAEQLYLSENTVKTHLKSLYRKTGSANRNDLYRKLTAIRLQDLQPDSQASKEKRKSESQALKGAPLAHLQQPIEFQHWLRGELGEGGHAKHPCTLLLLCVTARGCSKGEVGSALDSPVRDAITTQLRSSLRKCDSMGPWRENTIAALLHETSAIGARGMTEWLADRLQTWAERNGISIDMTLSYASSEEGCCTPEAFIQGATVTLTSTGIFSPGRTTITSSTIT